jgi:hypothetical protein
MAEQSFNVDSSTSHYRVNHIPLAGIKNYTNVGLNGTDRFDNPFDQNMSQYL